MTAESHSTPPPAAGLPEDWLEEHGDCLYGYALLRVRQPERAEDLVQETLLAAWRARSGFQGKSTVRSWLVGILKNKIFDHYRKRAKETTFTDLQFFQDEEAERFVDAFWIHELGPQDWARAKVENLDRAAFWSVYRSCLAKLPPRVADVFTLREMDDRSTTEICTELKITPSNLWVMLHRARMALRSCLEQHWFSQAEKNG